MAQRTEREVLQHLIEICVDGERGFMAAAEHVADPSLKAMFTQLADQRAGFAADLRPHLQRMGGQSGHEGTGAGALHRGWMTLKGLAGMRDSAIVSETERGEHAAISAYENAINDLLPPTVRDLVEQQRDELRATDGRLRRLHRLRAA